MSKKPSSGTEVRCGRGVAQTVVALRLVRLEDGVCSLSVSSEVEQRPPAA